MANNNNNNTENNNIVNNSEEAEARFPFLLDEIKESNDKAHVLAKILKERLINAPVPMPEHLASECFYLAGMIVGILEDQADHLDTHEVLIARRLGDLSE